MELLYSKLIAIAKRRKLDVKVGMHSASERAKCGRGKAAYAGGGRRSFTHFRYRHSTLKCMFVHSDSQ